VKDEDVDEAHEKNGVYSKGGILGVEKNGL